MKQSLIFILSLLCLNTNNAQSNNCNRWSMGTNFTLTNPIEEMERNGFRTNYGITFNALYNLNPESSVVNLHIGGRFTGGMAIGERDNITLEDPAGAAARSSLYNTLVDLHILGRAVINPNQRIRTYLDFFGGGRLLGSNYDIRLKERTFGYDRRTSERLNQSANWAWGTGAGVYIHLRENVYLDLGLNYTQSNTQEFLDLNSVSASNDVVQYEFVNSKANSVGVHVGFHFLIGCGQEYENHNDNNSYRGPSRIKFKRKKPRAKKSSSSKN